MKANDVESRNAWLVSEIDRLKKEKNAVIMAHYYQRDEIQAIADRIGDGSDILVDKVFVILICFFCHK